MQIIVRFLLVALSLVAGPFGAHGQDTPTYPSQKILFFSKSSGFEHGVIKQTGGNPSFVDRLLTEIGPKHHIEFVCSKDGSLFSTEYLAQFDAIMFYATGDLTQVGNDGHPPMTSAGKEALLQAIAGGKGFIGVHAASNAFNGYGERDMGPNRYYQEGDKADPYIRMLGGEFIKHDKEQEAPLILASTAFPGMQDVPKNWLLHEEWYTYKNFRSDLHVIQYLDTSNITQPSYARPNFPVTWARMEEKGRVFFTGLGHRNDVWKNPLFQSVLIGGVNWALKRVDADVTPNIQQVTPGANTLPEIYQKIGARKKPQP
jgi:uncharacterized protein